MTQILLLRSGWWALVVVALLLMAIYARRSSVSPLQRLASLACTAVTLALVGTLLYQSLVLPAHTERLGSDLLFTLERWGRSISPF